MKRIIALSLLLTLCGAAAGQDKFPVYNERGGWTMMDSAELWEQWRAPRINPQQWSIKIFSWPAIRDSLSASWQRYKQACYNDSTFHDSVTLPDNSGTDLVARWKRIPAHYDHREPDPAEWLDSLSKW